MIAYVLFLFSFLDRLLGDLQEIVRGWFITLHIITFVLVDIITCLLWPDQDDEWSPLSGPAY